MTAEIILELTLVTFGFLIMSYAIVLYFKLNKSMLLVKDHIDKLTMVFFRTYIVLMLFFLVGYGVVDLYIFLATYYNPILMISFIFFFGSIFVLIGITTQIRLTDSIYKGNMHLMQALISAVEARDNNLKGHSLHVMVIALLIYDNLPKYLSSQIERTKLEYASLMHDLGKLGIPESILEKPSTLEENEWALMKAHPDIGSQILGGISSLSEIAHWIRYHHERMDGRGYYGVQAKDIPLASRIITVADAYSAIVMRRSYKDSKEHDEALVIMGEQVGTQFDPEVFAILSSISEDVIKEHLDESIAHTFTPRQIK